MHETSDAQLLRDYAADGNEAAFRELVTRHTDFVYSAAVRQVDSSDIAGDIAQGVFADLARKARPLAERLSAESSLVGWLHRSTRYAALNHLRDTRRRLANERQAMEQLLTDSEAPVNWEQIRPALEEALDCLGDEDREALLLRYFKNQDFRSVGLALGVSDDTAQKRVSRAVERVREFFAKRGVTVGAGGLVFVISANAVQAAPAGLAVMISTTAATVAGTTLAATTTAAATKAVAMTTLQKALITTTVAVLAGAGIYEARQASLLRNQVQTMQQQQAPLAQQTQQLRQTFNEATNRLALLSDENERLNRNKSELLKLRGDVTSLRQAAQVLGQRKGNLGLEKNNVMMDVGGLIVPIDAADSKQSGFMEKLAADLATRLDQATSNKLLSLKASLNLTLEQEQQIRNVLAHWTCLNEVDPLSSRSVTGAELLDLNTLLPIETSLRNGGMSAERATENREAIEWIEAEFKTLLSPDQQSVYEQYKKDLATTHARQVATEKAAGLGKQLGLTSEQQDKAASAFYVLWTTPPEAQSDSNISEWFRQKNLKALEGILTTEQLEQSRRLK